MELSGPQELLQGVPCDMGLLVPLGDNAHGHLPAQGPQLSLQYSDARLPGVGDNDLPDGVVGDLQLILL